MALYPNTKPGKIGFFNSKVAPWTASATQIGTSSGAVTALQALVTAAQSAIDDQIAAEQAVKTKTATADVAVQQMVTAGADIIKNIRAKAANTADPNTVYNLAEIPAPATPTPVTGLGQPNTFGVQLAMDGAVTISWKCASPRASGVIYQVWRKLDGESEFSYFGSTGEKRITDPAIPAGSRITMYKVEAVRSTASGEAGIVSVMFGIGAGGAMTATVSEAPPASPKMAA